jgi:hypothetical protein
MLPKRPVLGCGAVCGTEGAWSVADGLDSGVLALVTSSSCRGCVCRSRAPASFTRLECTRVIWPHVIFGWIWSESALERATGLGRGDLVRDFACVMLAMVVRLCIVGAGVDGGRLPVVVLEFVCLGARMEVCSGARREES